MKEEKQLGKRKKTQKEDDLQQSTKHQRLGGDHLTLKLSPPNNDPSTTSTSPSAANPNPNPNPNSIFTQLASPTSTTTPLPSPPARPPASPSQAQTRAKGGRQAAKNKKTSTIPAPYLWATEHRARVHNMEYLLKNEIYTITGQVQCRKCEKTFTLGLNLQEKYQEVEEFISKNQHKWHSRAPGEWMNPRLVKCELCGEDDSCKPLISPKKKSINWLFLFLGQFLGACTLEQLKYFCKHTKIHRTGAKDRLLYSAYFELYNQLNPRKN